MTTYLEVTPEAGRYFVQRAFPGAIVMLNLLRFREVADYSNDPDFGSAAAISGSEAYDLYIAHTLPLLRRSGGDILFSADGGSFLIGPQGERWDRAMLVRQASMDAFLNFANDAAYLAGLKHRTAALEDSRLLPLTERLKPSQAS